MLVFSNYLSASAEHTHLPRLRRALANDVSQPASESRGWDLES